MKFLKILAAVCVLCLAMLQSPVSAQLTADFSLDSSNYFSGSTEAAQARAAVIAAVADLNAALNQNLSAITSGNQTVSGSFGTATVTHTVDARVTNPSNGNSADVPVVSPQSVVRIYFGARSLNPAVLGLGGPGSWGFDSSVNTNSLSDVGTAVANAANAVDLIYLRGEGPRISTLNGSFNFGGGNTFPFQLNFGLAHGNVTFNSTMSNFHFNHNTLPASNEVDFYSVALHETMHAIGLGPSPEWDDLVSGTSWTGSEVIALRGSAGALAADENHVAQNLVSPRIIDGRLQRSVLAPMIFAGVRFELTELDLAFMRDLGYGGAVVPDPEFLLGDFDLNGVVALADLDRFNDNIDSSAVGPLGPLDLNGNLSVDQDDFELMFTTLVRTSSGRFGTVAGDANLDGTVNVLQDAFALVANLGSPAVGSWSQGDFNADGVVDVLSDAFALVANLGMTNLGTATARATNLTTTSLTTPSSHVGIQCGCSCCNPDNTP